MSQAYVENRKVIITGGDPYAIDVTGNTKVGLVTSGTWNGSAVSITYGGTGASTASDARTNLGLAIGSDVQAYHADLAAISNGSWTGSSSITTVGTISSGTWNGDTISVANGGTGATSLTGYLKGDGTNAVTASSTIPVDDISGLSNSVSDLVSTTLQVDSNLDLTYNANNDTVTISVDNEQLLRVANSTYAGVNTITTVGTIATGTWEATDVGVAHGGTGASTAADARTNLGLAIGSDVQAYDLELAALAGVTSAADALPYFTGSGTADVTTLSSFARTLLDDADAAAMRATLGISAADATIQALANLTTSADEMIYATGSDTFAMTTITSFGRSLVDDANNEVARATLGLGSMAVQNSDNVAITGGTITADSVTVSGNLVVNGTTTTINSTEISVDDKNIELGATASPSDATADGGGITLKGDSDKTLNWVSSTGSWTSSENLDVASGKVYKVGGTEVLSNNTLGSGVVNSSLTSVGTIATGTWEATDVGVAHGGTGASNAADARTNLGLAIGTDVQAYDANTAKYDDTTANFTGSLQMGGSEVVVDSDIGSTVQAYDAGLTALAGVTSAANTLPYFTGSGSADVTTLSGFGRTLIDDADASTARSTLGLVIGTDVQAYDADTAKYDDTTANFTGSLQMGGSEVVVDSDIGSTVQAYDADTAKYDDTTANFTGSLQMGGSEVVVDSDIGSTVQAYDLELEALAGVTSAADALPYFTGSGTADVTTLSSFARTLLDDADAAAMRATLGISAADATIQALANLTTSADEMIYATGSDTFAMTTITSFGRSLVDDANNEVARATLGLGSMAVQNSDNVAITGGTITADSVTVSGNLVVNGTTTTINSTEISVDDKNIELGATASPSDATADGGGITLKGDSDKTLNWVSSTGSWTSSENLDVASGKVYKVGGTEVLSNNTLGSGVVNSSLTSVGTIATGTWEATDVGVAHGGTGASNAADARTNLGVAIGSDVQAYDAELAAIAGLTSAPDALPYFTGSGTADVTTLSSFGRTLIDDADASTARSTLGLGSMAVQNSDNVSVTGGTITGISELSINGSFNSGVTLSTNVYSNAKVSLRTPIVNLKTVAETSVFTVPTGYMFLIDSMEVLTTSISGAASAPEIRFGNTGDSAAYYSASTSLSNSLGSRHVIDIPQDGSVAGTEVTFGVTSASTATTHQGVGIVTGYLVKLS